MLGEQIGTLSGEMTGIRVLSTGGGHAVTEASFQATGKLLGADIKDMGTYESALQADGSLFGEGQGISMTEDGQTITWHGTGVGRFNESGGVDWRGAVFYETTAADFIRLNGTAAVFEFDTEGSGKVRGAIYEWK
ncbi:hypothetical protein [Streptomyces sp. NPDC056361]|uniref:hypothetical protein n=1 Tax=Streptomyces sp. NPDC056361 TaxID=3345795 RepID=UPI0035E2B33D